MYQKCDSVTQLTPQFSQNQRKALHRRVAHKLPQPGRERRLRHDLPIHDAARLHRQHGAQVEQAGPAGARLRRDASRLVQPERNDALPCGKAEDAAEEPAHRGATRPRERLEPGHRGTRQRYGELFAKVRGFCFLIYLK